MSHLRNNTVVASNCRIGNFVEFKNTNFGEGSKCAHLTYVWKTAMLEKGVNFWLWRCYVNYDEKIKFRTTIKDGAFIGRQICNLNLRR